MKLGRESLPWHLNVRALCDAWDYRLARMPDLCSACDRLLVDCKCDECSRCDKPVQAAAGERCDGYVFCDDSCRDRRAEAAYESFLSDFYGGSAPVTFAERLAEARNLGRHR